MSADNYMLVRPVESGRYAVTMEFASDAEPGPIDSRASFYETLEVAMYFASTEYTEYGVRLDPSITPPAQGKPQPQPVDLGQARDAAAARMYGHFCPPRSQARWLRSKEDFCKGWDAALAAVGASRGGGDTTREQR